MRKEELRKASEEKKAPEDESRGIRDFLSLK